MITTIPRAERQNGKERREAPDASPVELSRKAAECLAMVAHELRTPLNGILGFAQLLADKPLFAEDREEVQTILSSAEAMERILNDVLDFACLEADALRIAPAPFPLRPLMEEVHRVLSLQAAQKNIRLELRIDADVPAELVGDAGRLRQIVTNLVCNALKFTDQGRVSVRISHSASPSSRGADVRLKFLVEDTGIGIAPEKLESVFQPFRRACGSSHRPGNGLGLAIAKKLVDLMGGAFQVESRLGAGSKFAFALDFDLPLEPAPGALSQHC